MAKENGISMSCTVDDHAGSPTDISNDVTAVSWTMPSTVQDITGLNKTGHERLHLLADFTVTMRGVFNAALSHPVFSEIPTTSVTRTVAIAHSGQTLSTECILTDYNVARGKDGSKVWEVPGALNSTIVPVWA